MKYALENELCKNKNYVVTAAWKWFNSWLILHQFSGSWLLKLILRYEP